MGVCAVGAWLVRCISNPNLKPKPKPNMMLYLLSCHSHYSHSHSRRRGGRWYPRPPQAGAGRY
eukprot:scaffold94802_cov32-Tisochrysis_lutea.AAC.3